MKAVYTKMKRNKNWPKTRVKEITYLWAGFGMRSSVILDIRIHYSACTRTSIVSSSIHSWWHHAQIVVPIYFHPITGLVGHIDEKELYTLISFMGKKSCCCLECYLRMHFSRAGKLKWWARWKRSEIQFLWFCIPWPIVGLFRKTQSISGSIVTKGLVLKRI